MIDMPIPVRAIESDAHGQARAGLPETALVVLAQEVILRLARWGLDRASAVPEARPVVLPDIETFCAALIGLDPHRARGMIREAHAEGASHEDLCLHHLAPAARRLGKLWAADEISLHNIALAAGRILHLLRDLRDLAPPFQPRGTRSALFATVPGDHHVLGVTMAADIFRGEGWDVDLRLDRSEVELTGIVQRGGYPIVGLSAASLSRLRALAQTIAELRRAAPKILIFVSGHIARVEPDIATRVGADGAAWDIQGCRSEMERLHGLIPALMSAR